MNNIIKVEPVEQYFSINWLIGTRCNYDCMYCPSTVHDNHSTHHSLDRLQQAWIKIFNNTVDRKLKYKIVFTGGEVSTNKNFLPFVTWLRKNYQDHIHSLLLTTNGSASYNYYKKLFAAIDSISFSVHSEHINEQRFFDMIIKLRQTVELQKFISVCIMNEFWNQDRIPHYVSLLKQHKIHHNINEINYQQQTRSIPIFKGKLNLEI